MKMVMSFLRHRRSIVRWVCFTEKGRNAVLLRPLLLTVSMSRNRIFLPPQRRRPVAGDPGFWPAMDEDGPLARGRNFKLSDKPFALNRMSGALVVIIETDFAAGNHFRLSEQAIKLG